MPLFVLTAHLAHAEPGVAGYYAEPDVAGGVVVFASEGDLWTVPVTGGLAARLTRSEGAESSPRFSPDGRWIAFTADYDGGGPDAYVIPAGGGTPRRLTWHPAEDTVIGWTPDGASVLVTSSRDEPLGRSRVWTVPLAGGAPSLLPLAQAIQAAVQPDGNTVAFVPFGLLDLNARRYLGGTAADLYVGDLATRTYRRLTTWEGDDHTPMWHGDRLYFLSDRAGLSDVWSVRPDGTDLRAHTRFDDFGARHAAMGGDLVVFDHGGDLWTLDTRTDHAAPIPVRLQTDQARRRPRLDLGADLLAGFAPVPDGSRVVVEARGALASFPIGPGRRIDVSSGPGRNRGVAVSSDGAAVAAWNDGSGEEQLVVYASDGRGAPRVYAETRGGWHFPVAWSPAGDAVAWGDHTGTLSTLDLRTGHAQPVDQDLHLEIDTYTFSPDGRWLAWVRTAPNGNGVVWLLDRVTGAKAAVTDPDYHSFAPTWDPKGRVLYFLSGRTFDPLVAGDDSSPAYASGPAQDYPEFAAFLDRTARAYAIVLDTHARSPFLPADPLRAPPPPPAHGRVKPGPPPIAVDLAGAVSRTVAVPLPADNYTSLVATGDAVWALGRPALRLSDVNVDVADRPGVLRGWDLASGETTPGPGDVDAVKASADGTTFFLRRGVTLARVPTEDPTAEPEPVDLDAWSRTVDPTAEWTQIFDESWRAYRDFFWAPGMVGVDWAAKRARYAPLAARVGTRAELNDVIGEMIGELSNVHAYSDDGDEPGVEPRPTGLLGADLVVEGGGVRIRHIYAGASWDPTYTSPLAEPGVGIVDGDWLLAVDGVAPTPGADPLALLAGKADQDVVLRVGPTPDGRRARDVLVHTTASDAGARYLAWVAANRAWVAQRSGGTVGYLHIRDMMGDGFADFTRGWFAQNDRAGFVIDVRENGGGYVSQLLLDRIRRQLTGFVKARNATMVETDAWRAFPGPIVVLCDAGTASDGEGFTSTFQALKLGTVVGSRTWGGFVGYRVARTVVDGGFRSEPEFGTYDRDRRWVVEGRGVVPDVAVESDPTLEAAGRDPQLEKAVEVVLAGLAAGARVTPPPPPWPDLSLEAWRRAHPVTTVP